MKKPRVNWDLKTRSQLLDAVAYLCRRSVASSPWLMATTMAYCGQRSFSVLLYSRLNPQFRHPDIAHESAIATESTESSCAPMRAAYVALPASDTLR